LREFGDEKADVILKYYDEEAKELKELGEIPEHIKINEGDFFDEEDGIEYVGAEEEKEEDELDIDTI
jgi:translation initiation factor 1A